MVRILQLPNGSGISRLASNCFWLYGNAGVNDASSRDARYQAQEADTPPEGPDHRGAPEKASCILSVMPLVLEFDCHAIAAEPHHYFFSCSPARVPTYARETRVLRLESKGYLHYPRQADRRRGIFTGSSLPLLTLVFVFSIK